MIKLDVKDRKILSELDMDARQQLSTIAKKVRLSREVVSYRIKQLEKKGIIEGYYTAIDTSKLGYLYCRMLFKYRNISPEIERNLLNYCKASDSINWVSLNNGRWDITLVFLAKSLEDIENVYDEINIKFGKYLQDPYMSIAFKIYHFKNNYLYNDKDTKFEILGERNKNIEMDKMDEKILDILSDNARLSLLDIAVKLRSTPKLIKQRINKLVKDKVILAFRIKINNRLLGYDHYKVFLNLQNLTKENLNKLITYFRLEPEVTYVTKPMGQHSLEFEAMFKSANDLHEFLKRMSFKFSSVVVNYETMLCYSEPLLKYLI
jgi:DNA-binding Lrp family transcriptional regulator